MENAGNALLPVTHAAVYVALPLVLSIALIASGPGYCEGLPGVYSTVWCLCYKTNELKKKNRRGRHWA